MAVDKSTSDNKAAAKAKSPKSGDAPASTAAKKTEVKEASQFTKTLTQLISQLDAVQQRGTLDPRYLARLLRSTLTAHRSNLSIGLLHALIHLYDPKIKPQLEALQKVAKPQTKEDAEEQKENLKRLAVERQEAAEKKRIADQQAKDKQQADNGETKDKSLPDSDATASASAAKPSVKPAMTEAEKAKVDLTTLTPNAPAQPAVDLFLRLLLLLFAVDQRLLPFALQQSQSLYDDVLCLSSASRCVDLLTSRIFHLHAYCHEWNHSLPTMLESQLRAYRTCVLQHNVTGQATLTNCILRNHILQHQYTQADTFRLKAVFPGQADGEGEEAQTSSSAADLVSSGDAARYAYYSGRLESIQLLYSDAFAHLSVAIRKAPQQGDAAIQFRIQCTRLQLLVQLLMGEIPDRAVFVNVESPLLQEALVPYLALTRAVRVGDLAAFERVCTQYDSVFASAGHVSLIVRLRHAVIKTGLRKLSTAYSRLSLLAVRQRLALQCSPLDVESIVAKAISDGVIEAKIKHVNGQAILVSETGTTEAEASSIDATNSSSGSADPHAGHRLSCQQQQSALDKRIRFTNSLMSASIKALRFPASASGARKGITETQDESDEDDDELTAYRKRMRVQQLKEEKSAAEAKKKKEREERKRGKGKEEEGKRGEKEKEGGK